jgi:peroxiredoxin
MIKFLVQGSEKEPYETVFNKEGDRVTARCSCPAGVKGRMGLYCKHRFRILRSDTDGIVSANIEDVKIVQAWIAGSDIEIAVHKLAKGQGELERAKKKIAAAKKALAKVMSK